MSLHPTSPRRERILAFGSPNSGRSSTWLNIADWNAKTLASSHVYLGSTDRAWDAMQYPEIEPYVSVTDLDRTDFMPWIDWAKLIKSKVTRDDWVVVDMADVAWEAAQAHAFGLMTGGDMLSDIVLRDFLEKEKAKEERNSKEMMSGPHGSKWDVTKRYYFDFMQRVTNLPCHLLLVCDAKEIRKDTVEYEIKAATWKVGWMPKGQADLPKQFHTWLYCAETPRGWVYTSIRDKVALGQTPRELLKGHIVNSGLVMDYLIPVVGWSL